MVKIPKKTITPLRYPGGKAKLYNYTRQLLINNNLLGSIYVEPFAGGAGLAMELLFNEYVETVILNDVDRSIYALWHSILNQSEELVDLIKNTPISITTWHEQKNIQLKKDDVSLLQLGFSTLFLNRTNRSGIIGAGPIGGKNQNGNYKLDCRFNTEDIIERIIRINNRRDSIQFFNLDAHDFINQIVAVQNEPTFIFFDPPYHIKGPELYLNHYKDDDHQNLCNRIEQLNQFWIVTYDNSDYIKDIYSDFRQSVYSLNYSAQNAHKGKEVMIFSDNITPLEINHAY